MNLADTYRHKGMRRRLIEKLVDEGITNKKVLNAMLKVPRHYFFEKAFVEKAYQNQAFPIGEQQTISQPYTVAYQSSMLNIKHGDKVLEIGTGSGYQSCILAELGADVVSIERFRNLHYKAKRLIRYMGYDNVLCIFGDGYEGSKIHSPFDKILITAAAPIIPPKLMAQLKIGGMMVVPYGYGKTQRMLRITKIDTHKYLEEEGQQFRFVPMVKGTIY